MIYCAIINDNLEDFKNELPNIKEDINSIKDSVIIHKSFSLFKFMIEEKIITELDFYDIESINEFDNAIIWAKIILENIIIKQKPIENNISYFVKEDLGAFVLAALELNLITLESLNNIQEISESNSVNVITHLVNGKKINYNQDDHEILVSACYQSYTELADFILPFYHGQNVPYEVLEGLVESKDIEILEKVLNVCTFESEDLNRAFCNAISEENFEFTMAFFKLVEEKIDHQNALEHAVREDVLNICFHLIDSSEINVSFDYFSLLELTIYDNYEESGIFIIDKILNHKSLETYYVNEHRIIQSLEYNIDIFFKIFPLFKEYHDELLPSDNNIVIEAAKQASLKAFKMIYTKDVENAFNEDEDYRTDLLNHAVHSPSVLEFLLIEKNIDILDCFSFVEENVSILSIESFRVALKRADFIVRTELILGLVECNKFEIVELLIKDKRINNIEDFNICLTSHTYVQNQESLMVLFENNKIFINNKNRSSILNSIVNRNFKIIFDFLINSEEYSDFCLNDAFINSSKINDKFILETLISDERVTKINFENEKENILCNIFNNLHSQSVYRKEKLIDFVLTHEKIDTNVCDFEILKSLISQNQFNIFEKVFLKVERDENLISRLFEFSVKKPKYQSLNPAFYNYLYETKKVDLTYNNYSSLLSLLNNNEVEIFHEYVSNNNIPVSLMNILFEYVVQYDFIQQYQNSKRYNEKSYLGAVCSKSNIDNSINSYESLTKLLRSKSFNIFKTVYETKTVPEDINIKMFEKSLNESNKDISLFLYEKIVNKNNIEKHKVLSLISKNVSSFAEILESFEFLFDNDINKEEDHKTNYYLKIIFKKIVELDYDSKYRTPIKNIFNFRNLKSEIMESTNIYKLYLSKYVKNNILDF